VKTGKTIKKKYIGKSFFYVECIMSNVQLNSNSSSALVSSLDSVSSKKNPFSYSYAQKGTLASAHVPAHSRTAVTSYATSIGFNQNIDFPILKQGLLENCFLKIEVENDSGGAVYVNPNIMNLIVSEASLITAGRTICSSRPFGRAAIMSNKPYSVKKNMEKILALQAAPAVLANGGSQVAYIPLCFSCFDAPELQYLTTFTEPQTVRIRLSAANAYSDDNGAAAVNLKLKTCELIQVFRMLPSDLEQKMINEDYADTESLVRVQYDLIEESTTPSTAANAAVSQVFKHTFTTNRCASKIFFALENTNATTANRIASAGEGVYLGIEKVVLKGSGQTLFELDGDVLKYCLNQDTDSANSMFCVGANWDNSYAHTSNVYCLDFGMSKDNSHLTSLFSFREVNDLTLEITSSKNVALAATVHRLRVCIQSPQLESINSASGKISTSLSS